MGELKTLPQSKYTSQLTIMTNDNNSIEPKTLDTRVTKLENFISERLDGMIDGKVQLIENYFSKKIQETEDYLENKIHELDSEFDSRIDEVRNEIPDTYDMESNIEAIEDGLSNLESRVDETEEKIDTLDNSLCVYLDLNG